MPRKKDTKVPSPTGKPMAGGWGKKKQDPPMQLRIVDNRQGVRAPSAKSASVQGSLRASQVEISVDGTPKSSSVNARRSAQHSLELEQIEAFYDFLRTLINDGVFDKDELQRMINIIDNETYTVDDRIATLKIIVQLKKQAMIEQKKQRNNLKAELNELAERARNLVQSATPNQARSFTKTAVATTVRPGSSQRVRWSGRS